MINEILIGVALFFGYKIYKKHVAPKLKEIKILYGHIRRTLGLAAGPVLNEDVASTVIVKEGDTVFDRKANVYFTYGGVADSGEILTLSTVKKVKFMVEK